MNGTTMGTPTELGQPLRQPERVINTYVAPSKTFTDILRSTSWWLPYLLMALVSVAAMLTVDKKVGFDRVAENQIHQSPKREDQMNQVPPDQRAHQIHLAGTITKYSAFASPVFILVFAAIGSLVLWGTFNFGLGAKTTFGQMFAVWMFAALPRVFTWVLTIVTLLLGSNQDSFVLQDPVGTNMGYYMPDAAPWLKTALGFLDVLGLWNLVLLVIGTAIVARVKMGSAAAVIVGWWLLILLLSVGATAAFS